MAATIVSVVIFLCGGLVGRGVRAERTGAAADTTALNAVTTAETTPQQPPPAATPPPAGSDPTAATPPPAVDDLSYFNRLEKPNQPAEELKPVPARPAPGPGARPAWGTPAKSPHSAIAPRPTRAP